MVVVVVVGVVERDKMSHERDCVTHIHFHVS